MTRCLYKLVLGILLYVLALFFATIRFACAENYSTWLDSCSAYRLQVEQILDEEQLDRAYFYVMVAESRCAPNAISDRGARGFWQLMPKTSRDYGCHDPQEIECATRAAARYLKHLEEMFGQFDHVIAAYNMGGHNLKRYGATSQARGLVKRVGQIIDADKEE